MIYLLTEPLNTVESKGRVLGAYPAHWTSASRKQIHAICQPLKEKGVQYAYFSDLDSEAGNIVASELAVPFQQEWGLRRFNLGRHHGSKADHVERILDTLLGKWRTNLAVPIRGGDSWLSLEKRLFKTFDRLMAKEETSVVITDAHTATLLQMREPKALVMNGSGCKPGRVYVVRKES